jgi:hypothetical protein
MESINQSRRGENKKSQVSDNRIKLQIWAIAWCKFKSKYTKLGVIKTFVSDKILKIVL